MIRIKARTPTPAPRAPKPRAKAAKPGSVGARIAALDDLIERAERSGDRAEKLAAAICGDEESKAGRLATLTAEPSSLISTLAARALRLAQALDRCDVALNKALDGLG